MIRKNYLDLKSMKDPENNNFIPDFNDNFKIIRESIENINNSFLLYEKNELEKQKKLLYLNIFPEYFSKMPAHFYFQMQTSEGMLIEKNTLIAGDIYLLTKHNIYISSLQLMEYKIIHKPDVYLEIVFIGPPQKQIDLFFSLDLYNIIFQYSSKINIFVENRTLYKTEAIMEAFPIDSFDAIFYEKSYSFASIKKINSMGLDNIIKILIPLNQTIVLRDNMVKINIIPAVNNFNFQTTLYDREIPLLFPKFQVIRINKVYNENRQEIPHISEDLNGWYWDENFIYTTEKAYADVICLNKQLNMYNDNIKEQGKNFKFFLEKPFCKIDNFFYENSIEIPSNFNILSFLNEESIKNKIYRLNNLLKLFSFKETIEITYENIVITERFGSFLIPSLAYSLKVYTNFVNLIQIKGILNLLREKIQAKIKTENGIEYII